jgi:hypothetical protein
VRYGQADHNTDVLGIRIILSLHKRRIFSPRIGVKKSDFGVNAYGCVPGRQERNGIGHFPKNKCLLRAPGSSSAAAPYRPGEIAEAGRPDPIVLSGGNIMVLEIGLHKNSL